MLDSRVISPAIIICILLTIQKGCNSQSVNIDEVTGCPIGVPTVCEYCAEDRGRFGCYCELTDGTQIVTSGLMIPCPAVDMDPCKTHACQNGATCVREALNTYKCKCATGFGGDRCNDTLPKCSDPGVKCLHGECVEATDALISVYCQCHDGTRRDPKQNDTCPPSPCYATDGVTPVCQNNATCRIINSGYFCECSAGFAGQNCTKTLSRPLCEEVPGVCGEGKCQQSLTRPFYSCNCGINPSTFGRNITELTKCEQSGCYASNPCQNGGTCSNKGVGAFVCLCPPRFTGAKCERNSACFNNPCVNNGICEALNETIFFCKCPAYFTGQRCEIAVPNPCVGKNCGPFGQCVDAQGVGLCLCSDGFHLNGSPCEDPCLNYSCNTGVCTKKTNATFEASCSCPVERQGEHCENPRDLCRDGARCGGGYCKPNYRNARGYSCICEGGVVKDEPCPFAKNCPIKDCGSEGICVETDGIIVTPGAKPIYYVCLCKNGYISADSCDELINNDIPKAATPCGPNGHAYPSRNPNNPIGCWCKNGTHIPEIDINSSTPLCT